MTKTHRITVEYGDFNEKDDMIGGTKMVYHGASILIAGVKEDMATPFMFTSYPDQEEADPVGIMIWITHIATYALVRYRSMLPNLKGHFQMVLMFLNQQIDISLGYEKAKNDNAKGWKADNKDLGHENN